MSKVRDISNLSNIIKTDASGNVSFVSGSTTLATLNTSGQLSGSSPVLSSSYAVNATLHNGTASAQFAVTSSNTFTGQQYISNVVAPVNFTDTASLYTDGGLRVGKDAYVSGTLYLNNLTVYGTQSVNYITSSQLDIADNIITVNTSTPQIRFGGIAVRDSGSAGTGLTGSLLWDSQNNHWIYTNPSGSSYSGGMLISGPRNTGSMGDEQGTTFNALMKGMGGDHITSSGIFESGSNVGIGTNSPVTKLDVVANSDATALTLRMRSTDDFAFLQFRNNAGTEVISEIYSNRTAANTGSLIFSTNNGGTSAERMRITASGSVGIGTSSPNANLTVWTPSTTGLQTALRLNNPFGFTNANTGAKIVFSQDRTTSEDYPMSEIGAGQESPGSSSAGYIFFSTRNSSTINERMRITSAGNVGIGTPNPTNLLHVSSSLPRIIADTNTRFSVFNLYYQGSEKGAFYLDNQNKDIILEANGDNTYGLRFSTQGTERMRINPSGYVTKPYNPAFRAYYSVNSTWTLASNDTFIFNATEYNIGSCYNTSNGRFTAPVAGVYQFNFYSIVYGAYTNGFVRFAKNGAAMTSGTNLHFTTTAAATWNNVQFNTSVYLNSGDYVTLENRDMSVNYHGDDWSSFSGYLVG